MVTGQSVPELGLLRPLPSNCGGGHWGPCIPWSGRFLCLLASGSGIFAPRTVSSSSHIRFFSLCRFRKRQMIMATMRATAARVRGRAILHAMDGNLLEKEASRDSRES